MPHAAWIAFCQGRIKEYGKSPWGSFRGVGSQSEQLEQGPGSILPPGPPEERGWRIGGSGGSCGD